tara:strand:+ start:40210 stop:41544 length:1335 start_codon:yes stop_codon:yes gene_type:complete
MKDIKLITNASPYQQYLYSYPHKTSYRPLVESTNLREAWSDEDCGDLFLYMHVPFCAMRCGFCNLFTSAKPRGGEQGAIVKSYVDAIERQALQFKEAVPDAHFSRFALGGGTPTYLEPDDLQRLFAIAKNLFGMDLEATPTSVESSPETASIERLKVLREHHVDRISIGVQSFIDEEVRSVGRAQKRDEVCQTLTNMREMGFPILNIDLMYGLPGQTEERWQYSIDEALQFSPEEIYLYPLYVRPLTGVSKLARTWDDERVALYRFGRDYLRARGYEQVSMRMFSKLQAARDDDAPKYSCQEDGMVGLGPGARSYTRDLHYSTDYAVAAAGVREIITDYSERSDTRLQEIDYGTRLSEAEQKRRYAILSLLHIDGLNFAAYERRFGGSALGDFPELALLQEAGLCSEKAGVLLLTDAGFERADAIGPWLHSAEVDALMTGFDLK